MNNSPCDGDGDLCRLRRATKTYERAAKEFNKQQTQNPGTSGRGVLALPAGHTRTLRALERGVPDQSEARIMARFRPTSLSLAETLPKSLDIAFFGRISSPGASVRHLLFDHFWATAELAKIAGSNCAHRVAINLFLCHFASPRPSPSQRQHAMHTRRMPPTLGHTSEQLHRDCDDADRVPTPDGLMDAPWRRARPSMHMCAMQHASSQTISRRSPCAPATSPRNSLSNGAQGSIAAAWSVGERLLRVARNKLKTTKLL